MLVAVLVGVCVLVWVAVCVTVLVAVAVAVDAGTGVSVLVPVAVGNGECVLVALGGAVPVALAVAVGCGVSVAVTVAVRVAVGCGVSVGTAGIPVAVAVAVAVGGAATSHGNVTRPVTFVNCARSAAQFRRLQPLISSAVMASQFNPLVWKHWLQYAKQIPRAARPNPLHVGSDTTAAPTCGAAAAIIRPVRATRAKIRVA